MCARWGGQPDQGGTPLRPNLAQAQLSLGVPVAVLAAPDLVPGVGTLSVTTIRAPGGSLPARRERVIEVRLGEAKINALSLASFSAGTSRRATS